MILSQLFDRWRSLLTFDTGGQLTAAACSGSIQNEVHIYSSSSADLVCGGICTGQAVMVVGLDCFNNAKVAPPHG